MPWGVSSRSCAVGKTVLCAFSAVSCGTKDPADETICLYSEPEIPGLRRSCFHFLARLAEGLLPLSGSPFSELFLQPIQAGALDEEKFQDSICVDYSCGGVAFAHAWQHAGAPFHKEQKLTGGEDQGL